MDEQARDWRECVSCGGHRTVVDRGSQTERPCVMCRETEYAAWVKERQPMTRRLAVLDGKGRCCGRKPTPYKRPKPHLFCSRCCADFDPNTGTQIANWAWEPDGNAFVATSPTSDYAICAAQQEDQTNE